MSWGFENPTGGDTHFSMMRGTRANLVIRQNEPQDFRATLYAQPADAADNEAFGETLNRALVSLGSQYPGLSARQTEFGWEINIPEEFREGHEGHFTRVMEQYLGYLEQGVLPRWERTNLLTKYYITTQAYALAR